jgi:hypothetical protein
LPLGQRSDPRTSQIDPNRNRANDPNRLVIMRTIIPEDNRKDNPTEIPTCTYKTTQDPIRERVHVRYDSEVGSIRGIHEDCKPGNESKHRGFVVRICEADSEFEATHYDAAEDKPAFLAPDRAGGLVDDIGDEAACGAEDGVHETEHSGPAPGAGLS